MERSSRFDGAESHRVTGVVNGHSRPSANVLPSGRPPLKIIEVKNGSRSQRVRDEPWTCSWYHAGLGRLLLRDPAKQSPLALHSTFLCPACCPPDQVEDGGEDAEAEGESVSPPEEMVMYENSLSGWLDKEADIPLPRRSTPPRIQARGKRRHLNGSMSTCDACMRFIATCSDPDGVLAGPPHAPYVERICTPCHGRYRRCTDCGGRPDERLGVGRWRLKELFVHGKAALRPLVCADVESTRELRRYVGLRWHNPVLPRGVVTHDPQSQDPDVIATEQPPALVREGHVLHSFVGLEVDLKTGSLAIPLFVPRGIGHSYHAQSHLIQSVIRKAQRDLAQTNLERRASGLDPYPDINEIWLMNAQNKASRILHRDERLRGMVLLEEYLEMHADVTDPTHFPPHRSILLPCQFLKRYRFYARRFSPEDDLTQILRPASEERSKKKRKGGSLGTLENRSSSHPGARR